MTLVRYKGIVYKALDCVSDWRIGDFMIPKYECRKLSLLEQYKHQISKSKVAIKRSEKALE